MSSVLMSIAAFIVAIGVLITFHEFGHFWVARRLGVKVLRFSIGFGTPLWRRRGGDDTEYVIAALPLGGYVKMLDEREGDVPAAEAHRAFNRKSVGARVAIVAAGPVFNFIFAVLAYWLMFVLGTSGLKPVIGEVDPQGLAAQAGLKAEDEIVAVAGETTQTWENARQALIEAALDARAVEMSVRGADGGTRAVQLQFGGGEGVLERGELLDNIGIEPWRPRLPPVVREVRSGSPAARGGLRAGDRIVEAAGQPVESVTGWVDIVRAHPGESLTVVLVRDAERIEKVLTPERREQDGEAIGHIGASFSPPRDAYDAMTVQVRHGPLAAVGEALARTGEISRLTLVMLARMVTGDVSVKNLSGPITIAQYAGYTASVGLASFLSFLAVVSISLGILNLLPIPVLDGGHLMYYAIEWIKGSPLSEQAQLAGQKVGLFLLLLLMSLAFYNDFLRLMR